MPRVKGGNAGDSGSGRDARGGKASTRFAEAWASGNYDGELDEEDDMTQDGASTSEKPSVKLAMWDLGEPMQQP